MRADRDPNLPKWGDKDTVRIGHELQVERKGFKGELTSPARQTPAWLALDWKVLGANLTL